MTIEITHPYIIKKHDIGAGKPISTGTRTRISTLIVYYKLGFSAEELAREFPHLTLAQIHDGISYYYDHQKEIDEEIDDDSEENIKQFLRK